MWDMKKFQGSTYRTLFGHMCDALKLCRDPTSPVEIESLLYSCWKYWNSKWPTNRQKILFWGATKNARLRFFTPQRGRIGSFGSNIFKLARQPARHPGSPGTLTPPKSSIFPEGTALSDIGQLKKPISNLYHQSRFLTIFGISPPRWVVGLP